MNKLLLIPTRDNNVFACNNLQLCHQHQEDQLHQDLQAHPVIQTKQVTQLREPLFWWKEKRMSLVRIKRLVVSHDEEESLSVFY